jgi:arylsulfatase A-like enzyme
MDWGVYPESDEEQDDHTIADWAIGALGDLKGSEKPWMLCVGFRRPHVPLFASQEWFDLYPDDDSVLPDILENDRDDTPFFSWYLHWKLPEPRLSWLKRSQQWQPMTRAYLASVSFVDNEVGRVLAALDNSGQRKQTIIVLISDHGYHLGEKEISGKNTLWSESTRVPMIVSGPGIEARQFDQPTELLDVFPTVAELCGVPSRHDTEGLSLAPFLSDPSLVRKQPAITTHNQGNHSIRSERYRLIQYADGAQEFYDCQADPNEWTNLANDPEYATFLAEHTKWIPQVDVDLAAGSKHRTLTYRKLIRKGVELERVTWEDEVVDPALWDR